MELSAQNQQLLEEHVARASKELPETTSPIHNTTFGYRSVSTRRVSLTDPMSLAANESWKQKAFGYYESIVEVANVIDTTAKTVARCKLNIGIEVEDGKVKPYDESIKANRILRQFRGSSGGLRQILHDTAINFQVTGDGYLYARANFDDTGLKVADYDDWQFLSTDEIEIKAGVINGDGPPTVEVWRNPTGGTQRFVLYGTDSNPLGKHKLDIENNKHYLARGWRRNPRYSALSDCSLRKALGICNLLTKFTDLLNAVANSRLSAGILLVPDELSFGPDDDTMDADAEEDEDPLTAEIIEFIMSSIENRAHPESVAPGVLRGPAEHLKEIRLLDLGRDLDGGAGAIRKELISRLATALDAPREIIDGKSGMSHWGVYNIDTEFATKHVIPLGELIADFYTTAYLRPMLKREGMTDDEADRYHLIFDASNIIARADEATIARKLFEMDAISEEALLRYSGMQPTDAPTIDERRQSLALKLILASPVTLAPYLLPMIKGFEHVADMLPTNENGTVVNERVKQTGGDDNRGKRLPRLNPKQDNDNNPNQKDPNAEPNPDNQNKDKSPGGDNEDKRNPTSSASLEDLLSVLSGDASFESDKVLDPIVIQLTTAAHAARLRALDKATSRFVSRAQKDEWVMDKIKGIPKGQILTQVREDDLNRVGCDYDMLLENAFDDFADDTFTWYVEWLEDNGVDHEEAGSLGAVLAAETVKALRDFTLLSFFSNQKFDNRLTVPDELVATVIENIKQFYGVGV